MKQKREIKVNDKIAFVPLTKGYEAIIDVDDVELVSGHNWHFQNKGYAAKFIYDKGNESVLLMHRLIISTPLGLETDHINGNRIDNRKSNLRYCTPQQNSFNRSLRWDNTSGNKGVHLNKQDGKWYARIAIKGERHFLGAFVEKTESIEVYAKASELYHGEFRRMSK